MTFATPEAVVELFKELFPSHWSKEREAICRLWIKRARSRHLKTPPPREIGPASLYEALGGDVPGTEFREELAEQIKVMPDPIVPQRGPNDIVREEEAEEQRGEGGAMSRRRDVPCTGSPDCPCGCDKD